MREFLTKDGWAVWWSGPAHCMQQDDRPGGLALWSADPKGTCLP